MVQASSAGTSKHTGTVHWQLKILYLSKCPENLLQVLFRHILGQFFYHDLEFICVRMRYTNKTKRGFQEQSANLGASCSRAGGSGKASRPVSTHTSTSTCRRRTVPAPR